MNNKLLILVLSTHLIIACSDQAEQEGGITQSSSQQQDADEQVTQELGQKLLNATKVIGLEQESTQEALNIGNLKKLSEEDRQALIDLTIEESAKIIKEDADEVMDSLEENTRRNVDKR